MIDSVKTIVAAFAVSTVAVVVVVVVYSDVMPQVCTHPANDD